MINNTRKNKKQCNNISIIVNRVCDSVRTVNKKRYKMYDVNLVAITSAVWLVTSKSV